MKCRCRFLGVACRSDGTNRHRNLRADKMKKQDESQNLMSKSSETSLPLLASNADKRLEVSMTSGWPFALVCVLRNRPSARVLAFALTSSSILVTMQMPSKIMAITSISALNTTRLVGNCLVLLVARGSSRGRTRAESYNSCDDGWNLPSTSKTTTGGNLAG